MAPPRRRASRASAPPERIESSMSRSTGPLARWSSGPPRRAAAATAAAVGLGVVVTGAGPASAAGASPVVTRAALDPALTAGRGASVAFLEQEAEKAKTNGTVIGPDRTAYTLPAEASGRSAVRLTPGQYVEFTLPKAANAVTVRYSIPDSATGGGLTAPLSVKAGSANRTMTLT